MKKIVVFVSILFLGYSASSQELGLRFGDVLGNNVAVDGVFKAGKFSRIHANLSFGDGVGIEALWDFIYRPLGGEAFNWYVGVGPSLLIDDPTWFGASGEIGLEYRFNGAPLALGVDWRPTFFLFDKTTFDAGGFGLNIRYVFKGSR